MHCCLAVLISFQTQLSPFWSLFCISVFLPGIQHWRGVCVHTHLCMSSNSPHLACRDLTLLSYPFLLHLIKLSPWRLTKFPVPLSQYSHVRRVLQCYFSDFSRLCRSSTPCRRFSSMLFPSLLLSLPRWLLKTSVLFFFSPTWGYRTPTT